MNRRTLVAYAMTTTLVMVLSLTVWLGVFVGVANLARTPELEQRLEALKKQHEAGSPELAAAVEEAWAPSVAAYPWTAIRLAVGLLVFGVGGLVVGFWSRDPRWVGIMPLVTLGTADSINPAVIQISALPLPTLPLMIGLLGSQVLAAYAAAVTGARLRPKATPR